jgi:hypothetical protein
MKNICTGKIEQKIACTSDRDGMIQLRSASWEYEEEVRNTDNHEQEHPGEEMEMSARIEQYYQWFQCSLMR